MRSTSFVLLLIAACGGRSTTDPAPPLVPVVGGAGVDAEAAPAPPLDSLHPVFLPIGPAGGAPTAFFVDLLHPVVNAEAVGKTATGVAFTSSQTDAGTLVWVSRSRLRYDPAAALAPGDTLTLTLSGLPGPDGEQALPAPVTQTFTAPPLALHHATLADGRPGLPQRTMRLSFTGPVDPSSLRGKVHLKAGNIELSLPTFAAGEAPHEVLVSVADRRLPTAAAIDLTLDAGAQSALGSATAPAAQASVTLPASAKGEMSLRVVRAREGGSGFSIDVICNDSAAEGWSRWFWDEDAQDSYELSPRCELDPTSHADVVIEPAVPVTFVPTRSGFRIQGDLPRGAYHLRIAAGARTKDGGVLHAPWEGTLVIPGRSPSVSIPTVGRYLPPDAWKGLPIRHRNAGQLEVTVRHIPQRNLVFWMAGSNDRADTTTSEVLAHTWLPQRGAADVTESGWVDLKALVPDPQPGIYEILLGAGTQQDAARVMVTDLNLVVKAGPAQPDGQTWQAWVTGMDDHAPRSGAELQLVRPSGQVLADCTTDRDGACTLRAAKDPRDPTPPIGVLARSGGRLTYLRFADVAVPRTEADLTGADWAPPAPLRAALHTERGVYRPGETVHLAGVLRDAADRAPASPVPLRLDLLDPTGRSFRQLVVQPNAVGALGADVALPSGAATGRWEARLLAGDTTIATRAWRVEEFVPERMEVKARVEQPGYRTTDAVPVQVNARYLFGGSAEGSRVELVCRLEPSSFTPPKNGQLQYGHAFADDLKTGPVDLGAATATLNAEGNAVVSCPALKDTAAWTGPGTLVAEAAVFEGGSGRTSRSTVRVPVHPDAFYLGLKSGVGRIAVGQEATFEGLVVDWTGAVAADALTSVEITLAHIEEEWDWAVSDEGYESWSRLRRPVVERTLTVPVQQGRFRVTAAPGEDGAAFLVRAKAGGTGTGLAVPMSWSWDDEDSSTTVDHTPRPSAPSTLALTVPERAAPGDDLSLTFDAPYAGRALVTVETDRVVQSAWLDVKPGPVTWSFDAPDGVPTAHVSALLLKDPREDGAWLPDRAFGASTVRIDRPALRLTTTIDAPATTRAQVDLPVTVTLGNTDGPAFVAVAAVDEGVLALTRFKTPDPTEALFPQKALGIETFETIGWNVARPPAGAGGAIGGDEAGLVGKPTAVKPVALWSGWVETTGGKATVKLPLPAWDGKLRVMAIAATASRTGSAEATVVVRDPLVVQATTPRLLRQGDVAELPVFLTNTTEAAINARLSLDLAALPLGGGVADEVVPVAVVGGRTTSVNLPSGVSRTLVFRVRATAPIGGARLTFTASGGGHESVRTADLPIEPAAPRVQRVTRIQADPGEHDLLSALSGWTPATETTRIWVTPNPYGEALAHLDDLVRYPHGCLEQTISTARPLLYVGALGLGAMRDGSSQADLDRKIAAGIDRVRSMQLASGAFAYWPGGDEPHLWGTAWALHFLLEATAAGHPVPKETTEAATAWLTTTLDQVAAGTARVIPPREVEAYAHYVAARAQAPRRGRAQVLLRQLEAIPDPGGPEREATLLVHAALLASGDRRHEAAVKAIDTSPVRTDRRPDRGFYSDLRRRALQLLIHEELFGAEGDSASEPLARLVADSVSALPSWTTQELAWSLSALGKRAARRPAGTGTPRLIVAGKELPGEPVAPNLPDRRWTLARASERAGLTLKVDGTGPLQALLHSSGVRADTGWTLGGEGLRLTRTFTDAEGQSIDPARVALGDVVYTFVELTNTRSAPARNLALTSRVPAGWEIENPRLDRGGQAAFLSAYNLTTPDHLDLRDDALYAYLDLPAGGVATFAFAARATVAGAYALLPAEAEAMYDPDVWARVGGGPVVVTSGWEPYFF